MHKTMRYVLLIAIAQSMVIMLHAQVGKVGITTATPAAMLHVKDSSVVFTGAASLPGSPGAPPVTGAGIRMMWYPDKAAFRAGYVSGTQWNKDSIGIHSIAMGQNSKATGFSSVSMGSSIARGDYSVALGSGSVASGNNSLTFGPSAIASGGFSIALGFNTSASGNSSIAIGGGSEASGIESIAFGVNTLSSGYRSTAMGNSSIASGEYSISMNDHTIASGHISASLGYNTISKSYACMAIGRYNDTTNMNNPTTWVTADPVFVIGNGSANNSRSNAMTVLKNGNIGIGTNNPAFPFHIVNNDAGGGGFDDAIVIENTNTTTGESAILFQNHGSAGTGNKSWITGLDQSRNFSWAYGTDLTSGNTKMFLDSLGNLGLGTTSPQKKLHVSNGSSGATANTNAVAVFEDNANVAINLLSPDGNSTGVYFGNATNSAHGGIVYNSTTTFGLSFRTNGNSTKMVITDVGNVGIGTSSPSEKLHVAGNICYTGSIGACSDIRYKKNIFPVTNALYSLQSVHGIYYEWDLEKFPDKGFTNARQIGLSAQELETVYPEMVNTDANGYKTVDYSRLTPVLVESIKEQQKQMDDLRSQIEYQQTHMEEQDRKIEMLMKEIEILKINE